MLLAGGCNLYFSETPAPTPDGPVAPGADAPADASSFVPTRVIAYGTDGSSLLADTLVHFISPDHQIHAVMTGEDGVASASTPPDSTIVVFQGALLKIFVGTQPGDTVISGRRRSRGEGQFGEITIQLGVPPGGAAAYHFRSSCINPVISTSPTFTVPLIDCPQLTTATAIAWAVDSADVPITGPSVFRGINLSGVGSQPLQMPGYMPLINNSTAFPHELTNIPIDATERRWIERFFVGIDTVGSESDVSLPSGPVTMLTAVDWSIHTLEYKTAQFGKVRVDAVQHNGASPFAFDASAMICGLRDAHYDAATNAVRWEEQTACLPSRLVNARISTSQATIELHGPNDGTQTIALPPGLPLQGASVIELFGQILVDRLPGDVLVERSYSQSLADVDTNFAFTPVYWDPAFAGKVLEARAQ